MEKLYKKALPMFIVLGLGVAACGGSSSEGPQSKENAEQSDDGGISISTRYYDNGTRKIVFKSDDGLYRDILDFCDGTDLVEQNTFNYGSGNGISRTINHPACEDGILTPEDFSVNP